MAKRTEEEKIVFLTNNAREVADALLETTVKDAGDSEHMWDSIFVLQVASQIILANCAYNLSLHNGTGAEAVVDGFCHWIKAELALMQSEPENIEMIECKRPSGPTGTLQ